MSGNRPVWASRITSVAKIGLVIEASRHIALVPTRGPCVGRERLDAARMLGARDTEDQERDIARLHPAGGGGERGVERVRWHRGQR